MTLAYPAWLLLLGLLPVIVAAHLFFHEKRRTMVATLMFWRSVEPREERRFRLRAVLSIHLLLQLLVVTVLAAALARPEFERPQRDGDGTIVVAIDVSASTAARTGAGTRFDALRRSAARFVDGHSADTIVVATFAQSARVVGVFEGDDRAAAEAIERLAPTDAPTRIDPVIALADLFEAATLHIFTDGAVDLPVGTLDETRHVIHVIPAENRRIEPAGNAGIVAADATGTEPVVLFLRAVNYGSATYDGTLVVSVDGGTVDDGVPLTVEADGETSLTVDLPVATFRTITVELEPIDALPVDNRAYIAGTGRNRLVVALVTEGNPFIEYALQALPGTTVERYRRYTPAIAADLIVLDRQDGASIPYGSIIAFDSYVPGIHDGVLPAEGDLGSVLASDTHPVASGIEVEAAYFGDLWTVPPTPGRRPIFYRGDRLAAFSVDRGTLRVVSFGFDPTRTNIVLTAAFPRLVHNSVTWLAGPVDREWNVGAGQAALWPSGKPIDTRRTGLITDDASLATVGVNLFDEAESDIRPRPATVERSVPPEKRAAAPRSLWPILLILAALLLAADTTLWSRKR